jgi:hypothetical protein
LDDDIYMIILEFHKVDRNATFDIILFLIPFSL